MIHPSYQLNPGDMFQVDIEKVMYGTGQQKETDGNKRLRENLEARKKKADAFYQSAVKGATDGKVSEGAAADAEATEGQQEPDASAAEEGAVKAEGAEAEEASTPSLESLSQEEQWKVTNRALKFLLKDVKKILQNNPRDLTAKEKKQLRLFRSDAKRFLSHPENSEVDAQELMEELQLQMKSHELMRESCERLGLKDKEGAAEAAAEGEQESEQHNRQRQTDKGLEGLSEEQKEKAMRIMGSSQLSREEMRKLGRLLKYDEENPVDDSKPYATPWRPRPFMSAFAFIPRYLEVNPNICAAVYLRHPVARKGMAEVPTPFSYLTNQLTHNWYLERG